MSNSTAQQSATLAALQKRLDEMPILPRVLMQLLEADPNADGYFDRVNRLVSADPAFAVRLLRFANSPASAPVRPIVRVRDALARLGCVQAVNLVVAASSVRVFLPHTTWEKDLWHHAVAVACLAQHFAPMFGPPRIDPEEAFTCGLLHDLGRFVLYLEAPDDLRSVDETEWDTPQELIDAERKICGFTHTELGALAATKWGLPASLAVLIRHHHSPPDPSLTAEQRVLIELVRAVDWVDIAVKKHGDWRAMDDETLLGHARSYPGLRPEVWNDRTVRNARDAFTQAAKTIEALGL